MVEVFIQAAVKDPLHLLKRFHDLGMQVFFFQIKFPWVESRWIVVFRFADGEWGSRHSQWFVPSASQTQQR
jgi:hypothetical protein